MSSFDPIFCISSPTIPPERKVQEGVLLDANENPYPQLWQGVLLNRYPDPLQRRLRQALADYVGVGVENVVAGTGSDEVLDWIFKVFCNPGEDWVAIMEPTYGMYQITAQIFGIPVFQLLLDESFQFEAERFLKKILPQVKVVFLCSPNNPTGNLLDGDEILKLCREVDKVVVVDEALCRILREFFLGGLSRFLSQPDSSGELFPRLLEMRHFD